MMQGKVEICGVNTATLPLLKPLEKEQLIIKIKKGDIEARNQYISGNLRLVLSVMKRFSKGDENADDLFQIGCIGLIKAIDNFDETLNVKFSTYAVPMILGEIKRYLRDNNSIRVSRSIKDTAYKVLHAKEIFLLQMQREPSINDLEAATGIPREDIIYALDAIQSPMSLFDPVYSESGDAVYVMDQISDKKNREDTWVEQISLSEAIKKLNAREKEIIRLRFYHGKTQTEIANLLHISQAQVSRLEKNAIKIMRSFLTA